MRNLILFLIFLILSFSVNILFYYISDDYRNFLKQIKNDDNIESSIEFQEENNLNYNDDEDFSFTWSSNDTNDENIYDLNQDFDLWNDLNNDEFDIEDIPTSEIVLWQNYNEILDLFKSYDLTRMEVNANLFDLTNEYPDEYLEYYSKDLTLYFFTTRKYNDLKDIFNVLSDELPFSINEINNFWDNSFFINLNEDIDDNIVRIVIWNNWVVFWLKIRKNDYNLVKEKLNTLRTN